MRICLVLTVTIIFAACATNPSITRISSEPQSIEAQQDTQKDTDFKSAQIVKSPHGYVISGPKARFSGFVGDCSSDENFPFYWQCQAENAGNDYH